MSDERDDLSRLVRERRAHLGLSMRDVADRSGVDRMGASWVGRLENNELRDVPRPDQLDGLARVLGFDYQTVARAAAAQYLAISEGAWSDDRQVRAVVDRMLELDEAGRQELVEIANLFARRQGRGA